MFNPDDYEGLEEFRGINPLGVALDALLPPHVNAAKAMYHYDQQEQRCYTCNETGHFACNCKFKLQRGAESGGMEAPKATQKVHQKCPSSKVRYAAMPLQLEDLTSELNEDALSCGLGRDNVGFATIKGQRISVLLDMGANVNIITLECIMSLGL